MYDPVESRARAVLRTDTGVTVPLSRLHRALAGDAGGHADSYGQLRERLRRSPELFELVEPPAPLPWDTGDWPEPVRREYETALRRVGIVAEPRVALREPTPAPPADGTGVDPVLRRLDASLLELWTALAGDAASRLRVAEAMGRVDDLRAAADRIPPQRSFD